MFIGVVTGIPIVVVSVSVSVWRIGIRPNKSTPSIVVVYCCCSHFD